MSIKEKKEYKAAYLDALSINKIDRETLKKLHLVNDNILDKWLYVTDRYPTFKACWELSMFIKRRRLTMSKRLYTVVNASVVRVRLVSESLGVITGRSSHNIKSEGFIKSTNTYIYKGENLRLTDLFSIFGYATESGLYQALRKHKILPGDDVSEFKKSKYSGRPLKGIKYIYKGEEVTIYDLVQRTGLSQQTLTNRIHIYLKGKKDNDISNMELDRYANGGPKRHRKTIID